VAIRDLEEATLRRLRPGRIGERAAALSSAAAQRGAVWILLGLVSQRSPTWRPVGRRALAGWALAAAPSFLVKSVTDRPRPTVPWRSGPSTSSSSMPSSHTAGAVAFATAATMSERRAAPVFVLAGLVGWSRLATGRHFPTDVAAGGLIGMVSGFVVGRVRR
jgi:membrane-associated phospholipid phosphatase